MATLENAIVIAAKAHAGQTDKGGNPYILHPLRVMMSLTDTKERIVGVLHDIIEDTWIRVEDLYMAEYDDEIVEAILSVTRKEDESYEQFILRAKKNRIGRKVKIADIKDNSDLSRIPNPTEKDYERLKKYQRALAVLEAGGELC